MRILNKIGSLFRRRTSDPAAVVKAPQFDPKLFETKPTPLARRFFKAFDFADERGTEVETSKFDPKLLNRGHRRAIEKQQRRRK